MRARVVQSGTQSRDITDGHRGGVVGVGRIDAQLRVLVLDRVMRVEHKAMYRRIELAFQGVAPVEFGSSRNGSPM